jgi:hypothetical protein
VLVGLAGIFLTYRLALQASADVPEPRFGGPRAACISAALFAICPFVVYLGRLGLSDILMCTAGLWALLRAAQFIAAPTRRNAAWLGVSWCVGAFSKFPVAFVFLIQLPLALVFMSHSERSRLLSRPALLRYAAALLPVSALAVLVAGVAAWRVHSGHAPGFGLQDLIGLGGGRYRDTAQTIGIPRAYLIDELAAQLTWPVTLLGGVGLCAAAALGGFKERWLIAAGLVPMLGITLLAQIWFSRYLLFTLPPLIVASVCGWQYLAAKFAAGGCVALAALALCLLLMGRQSALLILDPTAARWSRLDRSQYIESWSSGYGYPEAARFIAGAAGAPQRIYSLDGHGAYQLLTYLPASWARRVSPVLYADDGRALTDPESRLRGALAHAPVWLVVPSALLPRELESSFGPGAARQIDVKRIAAFPKPDSPVQLTIYEVSRSTQSRT